jgi:hypothetical protein
MTDMRLFDANKVNADMVGAVYLDNQDVTGDAQQAYVPEPPGVPGYGWVRLIQMTPIYTKGRRGAEMLAYGNPDNGDWVTLKCGGRVSWEQING